MRYKFSQTSVLSLQWAFARGAMVDRSLRSSYRWHAAIGASGLGCFMLEDVAIEHGHSFVHSLWHLQSCFAVASANALMHRREQDSRVVVQTEQIGALHMVPPA